MRFVTVPGPVELLDPLTGNYLDDTTDESGRRVQSPKRWEFAHVVTLALLCAAQGGQADAQLLRDVRERFRLAKRGAVVDLSEAEWDAVAPILRRPPPGVFGHPWIFHGEAHARAWLDAPTEDPRSKTVNGKETTTP